MGWFESRSCAACKQIFDDSNKFIAIIKFSFKLLIGSREVRVVSHRGREKENNRRNRSGVDLEIPFRLLLFVWGF